MPQRSKRPCLKAGCPALVDNGYCDAHKRDKDKWRGSAQERGYDSAWFKVRKQALVRDKYLCQRCLQHNRVTVASEVHHLNKITRHPQLRLVLSNLISTCRPCHEEMEKEAT